MIELSLSPEEAQLVETWANAYMAEWPFDFDHDGDDGALLRRLRSALEHAEPSK